MNISLKDVILMLVLIFFIPGVYGVSLSISGGDSGDSVGSTTTIAAPDSGTVNLKATLGSGGGTSLSQSICGSGDLTDQHHYVDSIKGNHAQVDALVLGADSYTYSYTIYSGTKYVSASEQLTVDNADLIDATAYASNGHLYSAGASLVLYSGSVKDYSNYAEASDSGVIASQKMGPASSLWALILSESSSNINNGASHQFYSQGYGQECTLGGYSAAASATKSEAKIAADYTQFNGYYASDQATGVYQDFSSYYSIPQTSQTGYDGNILTDGTALIKLCAYSTKASSKVSSTGAKTTAESTLQAAGSPSIDYSINYYASVSPVYSNGYRSMSLKTPGKYSATAQYDGKKAYVNVAPVLK